VGQKREPSAVIKIESRYQKNSVIKKRKSSADSRRRNTGGKTRKVSKLMFVYLDTAFTGEKGNLGQYCREIRVATGFEKRKRAGFWGKDDDL